MLISYNWLKTYIKDIPNPDKVASLLTFHLCEIEEVNDLPNGDTVFDLKILPDRAHDLLSHFGIAREIAGLLGLEILEQDEFKKDLPSNKTNLDIQIDTKSCRRYMGRIIRGIKVGPSPEWIVRFLESVGQRSINNIVDATNIIMLDLGQPIHAFDLAMLKDEKIVVRNAKDGDEMTLVGQDKLVAKLKESDMVITDGVNNLAVAGVKGGLSSGIKEDTKDILIEVANFEPVSVRKTANRLGIKTDASKRYENDIPIPLCEIAIYKISKLILEMCPEASFEDIVDVYPFKNEQVKKVSFTTEYISKILGIEIKNSDIENILKNYKYEFSFENNIWVVTVPYMRLDLNENYDFAEEIGRIYGYENVPPLLPSFKMNEEDSIIWMNICSVKQKLINDGFKEVMTYAFRDRGEVEVLASASDKNFLRTNLSDGLAESLKLNTLNAPLLDIDQVKIFEIGTIFKKGIEEMHVAYGDKKGITEMTLEEYVSSSGLKSAESDTSGETFLPQVFKPWSIYPFMTRDIAVWVPEGTTPETLSDIYKDFGTELLVKEPKLFDQFTKDGRTSYAYRLVFQSYDRTLTDDEINTIMKNINDKILSLGFVPR